MRLRAPLAGVAVAVALAAAPAAAEPPRTVAVAPVEWRDHSALPEAGDGGGSAGAPSVTRTVAEALRKHLAAADGIAVVDTERSGAEEPSGLFDCTNCAAELARELGADGLVVGQFHRASGLISYLFLRLVDARSGTLLADYRVELKGQAESVAPRAAENFSAQVAARLREAGG
jgi:Protein of unknown function (DUF2380)